MKNIISILLLVCTLTLCLASCGGSNDNSNSSDPANNINNIFLSKSELTLGVGETTNLIATVSPGNIETTLTWSSSDDSVAEVSNQGEVTAKSEGNAVIKVEAPNGVLAVCNVTVKIKTGSVTGTVTYKYNNYVGNKPDTDAKVLLISKSVTSLPDSVALGLISSLPDGCYGTKVDGLGKYQFDDIPVGDYYIVIISKNTNSGSDAGSMYWGFSVYSMFSKDAQETANNTCWLHKIKSTSITVKEGQTSTFSHDFGLTYI